MQGSDTTSIWNSGIRQERDMQQVQSAPATALEWRSGSPASVIEWNKLMMWVFIVSDALLFAGFLASYGFARLSAPSWPDRSKIFHLDFIALMTFILISSSATMATAVAAARKDDRKLVLRFVLLTIL